MQEFNQIIKERASLIKKSILDSSRPQIDEKKSENKPDQDSTENNV